MQTLKTVKIGVFEIFGVLDDYLVTILLKEVGFMSDL